MEIRYFTIRQLNAIEAEVYDELVQAFLRDDLTIIVPDWGNGVDSEAIDLWDEIATGWISEDPHSVIKDGFSGRKNITPFEMYHDIRITSGVEPLQEMYPGADRERLVEMYVGHYGGCDGGRWEVVDVYVPALLPKETAVSLADVLLTQILEETPIVFRGVYCFWGDEMMLPLDEEE